jgi:hypothetical protein
VCQILGVGEQGQGAGPVALLLADHPPSMNSPSWSKWLEDGAQNLITSSLDLFLRSPIRWPERRCARTFSFHRELSFMTSLEEEDRPVVDMSSSSVSSVSPGYTLTSRNPTSHTPTSHNPTPRTALKTNRVKLSHTSQSTCGQPRAYPAIHSATKMLPAYSILLIWEAHTCIYEVHRLNLIA